MYLTQGEASSLMSPAPSLACQSYDTQTMNSQPNLLTGNVTHGMTLSAKASHQHLVVLLNVVEAAVTGHKCRDLLPVLDELDTHALPNGRVGLFGLNTTVKNPPFSRMKPSPQSQILMLLLTDHDHG